MLLVWLGLGKQKTKLLGSGKDRVWLKVLGFAATNTTGKCQTSCQKYPVVTRLQILKHCLKQRSFAAVTSPFHPSPHKKFSSYIHYLKVMTYCTNLYMRHMKRRITMYKKYNADILGLTSEVLVYEMLNKLQHINSAQPLFQTHKVNITFFMIMSLF